MSANGTNGANGNHNHNHADWTTNPRWAGISRPYSTIPMCCACAAPSRSSTRSRDWAPSGCGI